MGKYLVFVAATVLMTMSAQGQSSGRRIEILLATYGSADSSLIATETFEQACVNSKGPCTFLCKNESFGRRDPAPAKSHSFILSSKATLSRNYIATDVPHLAEVAPLKSHGRCPCCLASTQSAGGLSRVALVS